MCQASPMLRATGSVATPNVLTERPARRTTAHHKVVLLGTAGGSNPRAKRFGIANAVVVGDHAYVVDCGEGVHSQLWRAGIAMHRGRTPKGGATVGSIFLTHLHSDHVIDLTNLLLGFWPDHTVQILGPGPSAFPTLVPVDGVMPRLFRPEEPAPGTKAMVAHLLSAYAYNINVRIAWEGSQGLHRPHRRARDRRGRDTVRRPTSTSGSRPALSRRRPRHRRWSRSRSSPKTSAGCG